MRNCTNIQSLIRMARLREAKLAAAVYVALAINKGRKINQSINQSIYFIFHKSITRRTPYGYRNGQKIQVLEVIYTTSNVTLCTKEQLIK